jgi:replicative DNA helicase
MSNRQLYARMISQLTDVPLENILRTGMNEYQLKEVLAKADLFCTSKIFFDDTGGISLFELQNKARKLKREKNIEVLIIDYLQLVVNKSKGGNREGEVSEVSRTLKALAKELDIPIIALAQFGLQGRMKLTGSEHLRCLRQPLVLSGQGLTDTAIDCSFQSVWQWQCQ